MAQWLIRLANQGPVRIEVEDDRNLTDEYEEFAEWHGSQRWKFWERKSPFWRVTDDVVIHKDIVAGILPRIEKPAKAPVGFTS